MATSNFTSPGIESLSINGKGYQLVVYQDPTSGGYCGSVQDAEGMILTHSLLTFGSVSDCWAWCFGSIHNIVRGLHRE